MAGPNLSDPPEQGRGALELLVRRHETAIKDGKGQGHLFICPGESGTNGVQLPQPRISNVVIEELHSREVDVTVALVVRVVDEIEVTAHHGRQLGIRDLRY